MAVSGCLFASGHAAEGDPLQVQSRKLVQELAAQLQQALQGAIAEGGPVAAIGVCRDAAPKIASQIARTHGARVGRTSLRVRNALNAPAPWQRDLDPAHVLEDFEANHTPGAAPQEYFAQSAEGARYMSSIELKGLCVTCHGQQLAAEVADRLAADYPYDRAVGYRAGELRGAFFVVWPEDQEPSKFPR